MIYPKYHPKFPRNSTMNYGYGSHDLPPSPFMVAYSKLKSANKNVAQRNYMTEV